MTVLRDSTAVPGADPRLKVALPAALSRWPLRALLVVAAVLLLVLAYSLRPVTAYTIDALEIRRVSECGLDYHLFGGPEEIVTTACRDAFAPRALSAAILLALLLACIALMVANVQYWRGYALGAMWQPSNLMRGRTIAASALTFVVIASTTVLSQHAKTIAPETATHVAASPATQPPVDQPPEPATSIPLPPISVSGPPAPEAFRPDPPSAPPPIPPPPSAPRQDASGDASKPAPTPSRVPLRITQSAWYGASPTLLDSLTTPEDGLPVGVANDTDDRHSFIRLTGTEREVSFVEQSRSIASLLAPEISIVACPVLTDAWEPVRGGDIEDEPEYAEHDCIALDQRDDGSWHLDLPDTEGWMRNGLALVPKTSTGTWQVTLTGPTSRTTDEDG